MGPHGGMRNDQLQVSRVHSSSGRREKTRILYTYTTVYSARSKCFDELQYAAMEVHVLDKHAYEVFFS